MDSSSQPTSTATTPTDATVKTDIDPHHETATTTTIVHLPFSLGAQCPPPKVISWMKSKPSASSPSHHHHHHHHHRRHHPHQRPSLFHVLPFVNKKRAHHDKSKKGDRSITLFSIQVTVLGKVLVSPPAPTTDTASDPDTRTVPAQLNRAETTSYVIHRTFEDFDRLSDMVLRMGHSIHSSPASPASPSSPSSPVDAPALTALSVHHPYPGLYQTLLKQFSNVKANQRAFDASSTTHGFHEQGAFERILELNQYLENVWYWLLPENNPSHLDLSHERHEIMQWFKPLAQHASAHADGRQMRERPADDDRKRYSVLQQYGSMSSIRKKSTESATSSDKDSITKGTTTDSASTKSTEPETETDTKAVAEHDTLSSSSSSLSSSSTPPSPTPAADADADATDATPVTSGHSNQDNQNHKEDEQSVSELSLPSLSSSSASSCSSSSSASSVCISLETAEKPQGNSNDKDDDKNENVATPLQESSSSTLSPDSDDSTDKSSTTTATATLPIQEDLVSSDPEPDVKIRRRISLSHVFRSFTTPRNSLYHPNRQSMYEPGQRRGLKASASMPLSHSPLETPQEEIYIWNTVTTKYQPGQSTPLEAR